MPTNRQAIHDAFAALSPAAFLPAAESEQSKSVDSDGPLKTFQRGDGLVLSAISSRTFLREIVEQMMPLGGRTVFEIGSGTGYFAAVLGLLCGEEGRVAGCEILPDLYSLSLSNLQRSKSDNVFLRAGDFVDILDRSQIFDIIISTSSMSRMHEQILGSCSRDGGRIILPIEVPGGGDCFTIFECHGQRLDVKYAKLTVSVPTTGSYSTIPIWAPPIEQVIPDWSTCRRIVVQSNQKYMHFIHETLKFRSLLLFGEPTFRAVNLGTGHLARTSDMAFGLVCDETASSCLQTVDSLVLCGPKGLNLARRFLALQSALGDGPEGGLATLRYEICPDIDDGFDFDPGFGKNATIRGDTWYPTV